MSPDYLQKQTEKPLFPDLIWSRPETKLGAGKVLIIGGQAQEFINVAECYSYVEKAGAGVVRVIMPDSTKKSTSMLPNIEYAPSNQSGSFSKSALSELLEASNWADGTILAGDLGKNSETSLMLESFMLKQSNLLSIPSQALQSVSLATKQLFNMEQLLLTLKFSELQKMAIDLGLQIPLMSTISSQDFAQVLHQLTTDYKINLIVIHNNQIWAASLGNVSVTPNKNDALVNAVAAEATVWLLQNPTKQFKAITTSVWQKSN